MYYAKPFYLFTHLFSTLVLMYAVFGVSPHPVKKKKTNVVFSKLPE